MISPIVICTASNCHPSISSHPLSYNTSCARFEKMPMFRCPDRFVRCAWIYPESHIHPNCRATPEDISLHAVCTSFPPDGQRIQPLPSLPRRSRLPCLLLPLFLIYWFVILISRAKKERSFHTAMDCVPTGSLWRRNGSNCPFSCAKRTIQQSRMNFL